MNGLCEVLGNQDGVYLHWEDYIWQNLSSLQIMMADEFHVYRNENEHVLRISRVAAVFLYGIDNCDPNRTRPTTLRKLRVLSK